MGTNRNKDEGIICIGILLLALWALAGTLLALEFGFLVIVETTIIYFTLAVLIAATSYLILVYLFRRIDIFNDWKIIALIPAIIILVGTFFQMWILGRFLGPWISSQSGIALTGRIEPAFTLYAILGVIMLIFSMFQAIENVKREYLEKISPKVEISLDQNKGVHIKFKEGEKS